ncbi:cyclin-A1 [Ambystoma mexicanum]
MRRSSSSNGFFRATSYGQDNSQMLFAFTKRDNNLPQPVLLPQRLHQRAVLGVLTENDQHRRSIVQAAPAIAFFPGVENVVPFPGKSQSTCVGPKPGFTIYVDEPREVKDRSSYRIETVEPAKPPLDMNVVKNNFHLVLDLSTGSPMAVDTSLPSQLEDLIEDQPEEQPDAAFDTDIMITAEYFEDIHRYLREAEMRHRPKACYMRKQPDITASMRTILVDWLVEVGEEYKLRAETVYLAVNFLDRFLSCMSVLRGKLQLVGTAAILLASKYEEIYPPEVDEFVYITDDTYTKKQLLRMEHLLLKVLAFDLTVPTTNQFLLQYLQRHGVCVKTEYFARYVAELSLLEAEPFLKYVPSLVAAAAYCLANYTMNKVFWPESLVAFTGYSLSEIVPCLGELHRACLRAPAQPQQAIREKYKNSKYRQVALVNPPAVLPLK